VRFLAQPIPVGDREGLDAHIAEALPAQHFDGPVARTRFRFRACKSGPHFGDKVLDDVPGQIAFERGRCSGRGCGRLLLRVRRRSERKHAQCENRCPHVVPKLCRV
jgi:hypothetical protein